MIHRLWAAGVIAACGLLLVVIVDTYRVGVPVDDTLPESVLSRGSPLSGSTATVMVDFTMSNGIGRAQRCRQVGDNCYVGRRSRGDGPYRYVRVRLIRGIWRIVAVYQEAGRRSRFHYRRSTGPVPTGASNQPEHGWYKMTRPRAHLRGAYVQRSY